MTKFFFLLILSVYGVATASIQSDPYKNIEYYLLDNGMQVYLLSDKKAVNTEILLTVRVGYDIEDKESYGLSHLVEHIVFRDQRVPYRDYLDYIKEEGGTYVNGYTKRYESGYYATIDSNRSYWIAKTFADMVFDKNVTDKDLTVEKGALQTEIGEAHWYQKIPWNIGKFFEAITAPEEHFYEHEFSLSRAENLPARYHAQENNEKFTLNEVMKHFDTYYYPANMTLNIVGNFSIEKMKNTIAESYGVVTKQGTMHTQEPPKDGQLNGHRYHRFHEGAGTNRAYIGAKYLRNDYKEDLILDIYTANLAKRLQQQIRNKLGKTYSVSPYGFYERNAGVATVSFDSLHDDFEENIKRVRETIEMDIKDINDSTIADAMSVYNKQYYQSVEHDSSSLKDLLSTAKYLREEYNITDKTSYEIFQSITPQEFRDTLQRVFTPQNSYELITRDYHYFPMDALILNILFIILFILIYKWAHRMRMKKQEMGYTHRDIVIERRVSSRFIGFLLLSVTMILSVIAVDWIVYLLMKFSMNDPYYHIGLDVPYSYLVFIINFILFIFVFVAIHANLWRYYARLEATKEALVLIGSRVKVLKRGDIVTISTTPWSIKNYNQTLGTALLFWRSVSKIEMRDGTHYYLRSSNAAHLSEDLNRWLERRGE